MHNVSERPKPEPSDRQRSPLRDRRASATRVDALHRGPDDQRGSNGQRDSNDHRTSACPRPRRTERSRPCLRALSIPRVRHATVVATLVVLLLCASVLAPLADARPPGGESTVDAALATGGVGGTVTQVDGDDPANESGEGDDGTVPPHVDPDDATGEGDLTRLESRLADLLVDRLGRSTVSVEAGDYERARAAVGDDYDAILRQYVVVANATGDGEAKADRYRKLQREQQAFADSVAQYNETQTRYRAAKQSGNETGARALARELERLSRETTDHGDRLTRQYSSVAGDGSRDVSSAVATIDAVKTDVERQQAAVQEAEFVPTRIEVTSSTERGSFVEPIRIAGTISVRTEADDGWVPVNEPTATVAVNGTAYVVPVGDGGTFAVDYRPTTTQVGAGTVPVEYLPAVETVHLGSRTTTAVEVVPSTATLVVTERPAEVRYGSPVVTAGRLTVDDVPAQNVPVTLAVGGTAVGVVKTDAAGEFRFGTPLPADAPPGDQSVTVALRFAERAVTASAASVPTRVERTPTALTVSAVASGVESVAVSGRLTTGLGSAVDGQPVQVRIAGRAVGTAVTGSDGEFTTTVGVPSVAEGDGVVDIRVRYDGGARSNLEPTERATTTAVEFIGRSASDDVGDTLVSGFGGSIGFPVDPDAYGVEGLLVGGVAAVAVGGLLVRRRARRRVSARAATAAAVTPDRSDDSEPAANADVEAEAEAEETGGEIASRLLTVAHDELEAGSLVTAINASYVAARLALASAYGLDSRGTHREFLDDVVRAVRDDSDAAIEAATVREFRRLTATFERAAFSAHPPSAADAVDALDGATALVSLREAGADEAASAASSAD